MTLDLHGKTIDEATDLLDRFLTKAGNSSVQSIRIMTGKGIGKIRTHVQKLLQQGGFYWKFERFPNGQNNEGVLVVFMD